VNDSPSRHNVRGCSSACFGSAWLAQKFIDLLPEFLLCKGAESGEAALRPVSPHRPKLMPIASRVVEIKS
jgi:hypothetical protein